jgi:peptide/nickel transport system substrate-binding protein
MSSKSGYGRWFLSLAMMLALMVSALPHNALAASASSPVGDSRKFPETNQTVEGRFLDVWSQNGDYATNLYINGFPITDKHDEINLDNGKTYPTQWFERARFEDHTSDGNKAPYDVLLGRLGAFVAEGRTDAPFKAIADPKVAGTDWFKETGHSISGDIKTYFYKYGGVSQFGFPLSETFTEVSKDDPSKSYTVQYFERQRMELHPENGNTIFRVLLGRLGAEQMNQSARPQTPLSRGSTPVDTLRMGRGQDPSTLLPYNDSTLVGTYFLSAIFDSLVARDDKEQLYADLALYVPSLENGGAYYTGTGADKRLTVKYKLKRGVKWFDGTELTSQDFIDTMVLVLDPNFPAVSRQIFQQLHNIDNPDAYTLLMNFNTYPEATDLIKRDAATYGFMQGFVDKKIPVGDPLYIDDTGFTVLPMHFLKNQKPADIPNSDYALTPWGTGPYHATKFETGQEITMEINPNYNVMADKPVIKTIYSPLFSDNKQLPVGMDTGTIDLTTAESITPDQAPALTAVAAKGKVSYVNVPSLGYEHIDFNTTKAPFNDVKVRQAFAYAIDRDAINNSVFAGALKFINTVIPPTSWASCENAANSSRPECAGMIKYNLDVAKANSLLDSAGWSAKGADGIRTKDGKRLSIDLLTTTKSYRKLMVSALPQMLKAVGIEAKADPQPAGQVFAAPPDGPLYSGSYGDFGTVEFAWADVGNDEPFSNLYITSQIPQAANSNAGQNDTFWSNAQYDSLYADEQTGLGHAAARLTDFLKMQVIENNEIPSLPMFALPTQYLVSKGLQNFKPGSFVMTWNINQWYMSK